MKLITCFFLLVLLKGFSQVEELKKAQDVRKAQFEPSNKVNQRKRYDFTQHVNPFIGTGGHGHTFPGAVAPFGMIQLSPDTRYNGWDGCSGYHYSDSVIYGFSHTHLSGTGVEDLCDLLIVPQQGKCNPIPAYKDKNGFGSPFSHKDEVAKPGFYAVKLRKEQIDVRLAVTERAGIHEYTFHKRKGKKFILIDLDHRDKLIDSDLKVLDNKTIQGSRQSNSWAKNQQFFFHLETNEAFTYKFCEKNKLCLIFPAKTKKIILRVGISAVDCKGAQNNLFTEIQDFDVDRVAMLTKDKWNIELNKIHLVSQDSTIMTNFYTAQYHAYTTPIIFSDVDGRFRGNDDKIYENQGYERYSIFSIWDTYRSAHPLYTLSQQKRTNDFIQSFLGIYKETNELPVWELWGNETDCMIGYHATSIILDAYRKGIKKYDAKLALEAMLVTSQKKELGKNHYADFGFISSNQEPESVSKTLEYAYDDWTISEFSKDLGDVENNKIYSLRSLNFLNLYNPYTKFMQPRKSGLWLKGFNPSEVNFNYTEANSWQYSLSTAHAIDIHRYMLGGRDSLASWLDRLFTAESKLDGRQQADITGLIGQYAHGNEPSHHMAYLYNYTNEPYKTQEKIDQILRTLYSPTPDGLSGNEDCGQMSAWYVLSAIGLYPVCPGNPTYTFGRPIHDYVGMHFENGKSIYIRTKNNSPENKYIQSISLNGKNYEKLYIHHDTLMLGGELIFTMGAKPNLNLKNFETDENKNLALLDKFVPAPFFTQLNETFYQNTTTEIKSLNLPNLEIRYTTDGNEPSVESALYSGLLRMSNTSSIKAKVFKNGVSNQQNAVIGNFYKIDENIKLELNSKYSNQYTAGGDNAFIDKIIGTEDYRSGAWQGYEGVDVSGTLKFILPKKFRTISFSCLQDTKSWIFFPKAIAIEVTYEDQTTEKKLIDTYASYDSTNPYTMKFSIQLKNQPIANIKFNLYNIGICPQGHLGEGEKAWMFMDEIELK